MELREPVILCKGSRYWGGTTSSSYPKQFYPNFQLSKIRRKCQDKTKPFAIPKQLVMQAYKLVKANAGSAGVDNESLENFETNLKGNLYKIWNRMSSGSYLPPPVMAVEIPKKSGGNRILGNQPSAIESLKLW